MSEHPLDAEVVAALLDGRLSGADRAAALAKLEDDQQTRALLVDSAAIANELRQQIAEPVVDITPTSRVSPIERAAERRDRRRPLVYAALAAAALLVVASLRRESDSAVATGRSSQVPDVSAVFALAPGAAVTDAMRDGRWSQMRSGSVEVSAAARASRLGVLAVDATVAMRAGSDVLTAEKARVFELLDGFSGSAPAASLLRMATDSAGMRAAFGAIRALSDTTRFDAGVWVELQLLSAASGGVSGTDASRGIPDALRELARADSALEARVRELERAMSGAERTAQLRAVLARLGE